MANDTAGDSKFLLVPIDPTPEMVEAGRAALSHGEDRLQTHARVMWVWEAMIKIWESQNAAN